MNNIDRAISDDERAASPMRFQPLGRPSHEIERILTASTTSTSSSENSISRRNTRPELMSRMSTQRDLERHPTELSRIQTQRSQHTGTVGRSLTGKSRDDRRPLPGMGAGKAMPPALPEQEEYVVEFDGPEDPLHAQNWSLKKK